MIRFILVLFLIVGCTSQKSKCKKIPWYKRQPNKHFKSDQKANKNKYKNHKRQSKRRNKCKTN